MAGRKAAADGQTTAHRSRPALFAGHNKFPPQDLGTPQGSPAETIEADMCTEVLTCAMPSDFAVNVICYGYGGLAQASATRLLNFQPSGSTQPQTWRSAIAGRLGANVTERHRRPVVLSRSSFRRWVVAGISSAH